jgi:hypothetical protein
VTMTKQAMSSYMSFNMINDDYPVKDDDALACDREFMGHTS